MNRQRPPTTVLAVLAGVLAVGILAGAEVLLRLGQRAFTGEWPATRQMELYSKQARVLEIYRLHPYLNVGPRASSEAEVAGKRAAFNSLGFRSPERSIEKSAQSIRVLVSGGSAAFDLLASSNHASWPWLLENLLQQGSQRKVEVWNAGFPGWTTLENTISLALRDRDLQPDIALLLQGVNDLQPGGHRPFDPQYVHGHAEILRQALGFELEKPSLLARSLLLEKIIGPAPSAMVELSTKLEPGAAETFRRNVSSWIALAIDAGATPVLVSQPIRIRSEHQKADRTYLELWLRMKNAVAIDALGRYNDVLRELATSRTHVYFIDAAAALDKDEYFLDPFHFSAAGAERLALFLQRKLHQLTPEDGIPER